MAIELNKRTKILAGGVVLVAALGAAWFLFLDDFLNAPPPKPAATAPAKPAAKAGKAEATAPAPAADTGKAGAAPKPAATAAKPIPSDPAKLVAEVIETSGLRQSFLIVAREIAVNAVADDAVGAGPAAADAVAASAAAGRQFEPAINAEIAAALRNNLDAERMSRFLELLRQPAVTAVVARETAGMATEAHRAAVEAARKTPPAAERAKLVQALDDITRRSEVGGDMANAMARAMVDTMLDAMQKSKKVPAEARQAVGARLNAIRSQARAQIRAGMTAAYRDASDEEFAAYVKALDTDTGRWGLDRLAEAIRPAVMSRATQIGKDLAPIALARRAGPAAAAAAPVAEPQLKAPAEPAVDKPAPVPVAAAPAAPVGYQRAAGIKDLYTRYNDVITATVMRDRAAVKELLDDGKSPNVRQSDGTTPLMVAVANGDADIAALLLDKGADANARAQGGVTALSIAKSRGPSGAPLVQQLQRAGAKD